MYFKLRLLRTPREDSWVKVALRTLPVPNYFYYKAVELSKPVEVIFFKDIYTIRYVVSNCTSRYYMKYKHLYF